MSYRNSHIIAIDFDGTCVEHDYPSIGLEVEGAVEVLRALNNKGHRLILYTMRSETLLQEAVEWFNERKIALWAINKNPEQSKWTASPKVYADIYIDDAALGCPTRFVAGARRPVVDWHKVRQRLEYDEIL